MIRGEGACLVCGRPVVYYEKAQKMECMMCHKQFESHASCEEGHFVCDECHGKKGIEVIIEGCLKSDSKNPVFIIQELMKDPYIYMHGPEHHVLVGAALLTAYHNAGGSVELEEALREVRARGREYPGGSCGLWGCCGAAVSAGIFMSVITKATPLTGRSWGLSNKMTAKALDEIAGLGGPRCCKRNSFTAARAAVEFVDEKLNVKMELPEHILCDYSPENQQCLKKHCPYYNGG